MSEPAKLYEERGQWRVEWFDDPLAHTFVSHTDGRCELEIFTATTRGNRRCGTVRQHAPPYKCHSRSRAEPLQQQSCPWHFGAV